MSLVESVLGLIYVSVCLFALRYFSNINQKQKR